MAGCSGIQYISGGGGDYRAIGPSWLTCRNKSQAHDQKSIPLLQLLNFSFVPSAHRVLFVNVVSVGWNTFLAWSAHRTHRHDASDSSPSNSHTKVPPQLFACAHSSLPRTSTEPPTQNIQSHHTQSPTKTAQQLPCIICKAATKEP